MTPKASTYPKMTSPHCGRPGRPQKHLHLQGQPKCTLAQEDRVVKAFQSAVVDAAAVAAHGMSDWGTHWDEARHQLPLKHDCLDGLGKALLSRRHQARAGRPGGVLRRHWLESIGAPPASVTCTCQSGCHMGSIQHQTTMIPYLRVG